MKFLKIDGGYISFKCPGCKGPCTIPIEGPNAWGFNGDYNKPTLTPSVLSRRTLPSGPFICHSYIRDGMIQFLSDCTHLLAGQTVMLDDVACESDLFYSIDKLDGT